MLLSYSHTLHHFRIYGTDFPDFSPDPEFFSIKKKAKDKI